MITRRANPAMLGRVYTALRLAGRPVTRGEMYLLPKVAGLTADTLQAALNALVAQGLVATGTYHNPYRNETRPTYYARRTS